MIFIIILIFHSSVLLENFLPVIASSSKKDDFPFTAGFYYAEDAEAPLSFPYPDAELRFHFESSPDVRITSPISKKEYKHVKDLVKIPPAGVEPGTYNLKWYSGSKVVHSANYTINFVGCKHRITAECRLGFFGSIHDGQSQLFEQKVKDNSNQEQSRFGKMNFQKITLCHERITDSVPIEPAEGICVRTSKGKQDTIRKLITVKECDQNAALSADRNNHSICMTDGREVKTVCDAYLTYTMKNRLMFENLNSCKCQPYEQMNLSFAWNFYSCDRKMDVQIYHDSYYEARLTGQLKLCIYCGTQWKGYTFHIDILDKKVKKTEVVCNISVDQYIIVEPQAKKSTILIYGRDSSNVRQLRIRTIYVTSERADSTSKDKAPKLSPNPECDRKARIKTTSLRCEWKNTIASLYQNARVDVRYMLTDDTILQNNDELLEIHNPGNYVCQVRVYPAVCPLYDDKKRIYHMNAKSNVVTVTEDCISSLLKPLTNVAPKQSSLNFILVIVFSCIIVLTAVTVVVIYVVRRSAKKKRKSWLISTSTDEEGEKKATTGTMGTKSASGTAPGNTKSAESNKATVK